MGIVLLVLFVMVMFMWLMSLLGSPPAPAPGPGFGYYQPWLAWFACLFLGISYFLTGFGVVTFVQR